MEQNEKDGTISTEASAKSLMKLTKAQLIDIILRKDNVEHHLQSEIKDWKKIDEDNKWCYELLKKDYDKYKEKVNAKYTSFGSMIANYDKKIAKRNIWISTLSIMIVIEFFILLML